LLRTSLLSAEDKNHPYAQLNSGGEDLLTPSGSNIVIGYDALVEIMTSAQFLQNNILAVRTRPWHSAR
jgi:hypothetical protein